MQRIFPLLRESSFDELSEHVEASGAELTRLESCTFPSRPEARVATWSVGGEPVARYRYEPDIELRWFACDRPELLEGSPLDWGVFDTWENLEAELRSDEWSRVFRGAAAFRVAAENREEGVDGEAQLVAALSAGPHSAQAAASQLASVATSASREAIEAALQTAKNVETRVDLRRALEKIEMEAFRRR